MVNRLEIEYKQIMSWRERFEKLFSAQVMNSRAFKLEQLGMFERLLNRPVELTSEEKTFKKLVNQEKNSLERALYPNALVRFGRRIQLFIRKGTRALQSLIGIGQESKSHRIIQDRVQEIGFSELDQQIKQKIASGLNSFNVEQSEPLKQGQLQYSLEFVADAQERPMLVSIEVKHLRDNNQLGTFRFDPAVGLDRDMIRELVQGRAINVRGNIWKTLDLNDRDSLGNCVIREINVPKYDLKELIDRVLPASIENQAKSAVIAGLQRGMRVPFEVMIDGQNRRIELEAAPLRRNLQLFEDGKKISSDQLNGKLAKVKKLQLDSDQKQKSNKRMRVIR